MHASWMCVSSYMLGCCWELSTCRQNYLVQIKTEQTYHPNFLNVIDLSTKGHFSVDQGPRLRWPFEGAKCCSRCQNLYPRWWLKRKTKIGRFQLIAYVPNDAFLWNVFTWLILSLAHEIYKKNHFIAILQCSLLHKFFVVQAIRGQDATCFLSCS